MSYEDDIQAPVGAVLFDLDGVIVDSTGTVADIWRDWALRRDIDPERLIAFSHGRPTRETLKRFAPELDPIAEGLGLEREAVRRGAETIEGVAALYRALPDGARAVATSASRETALARFEAAGLPLPRVLVTADDVAAGKPAPDCYLLAAALLDVPPADCIVVEDAPAGIDAARGAGMRVIALTTTHPAFELVEADVCLGDPDDLTRVVERLRRSEPVGR
ncbi:MAG TPA: HAD-IA family hydrolase [Thermoleophilaceae bacterium]